MDKDFLKEKIAFYKLWLTFLVTMDASTMAWFFNNANKIHILKVIITIVVIVALTIFILILIKKTRKHIKLIIGE
ncbi:MAG: hypothetical protein A2104_04680 [Candidatus Melainabacteria bacterium GWF2_32_7]|nr:MAG: hypothetical protein A2104_04680 [Candidatus Melainabacteria bacterium GWF2_32_7]